MIKLFKKRVEWKPPLGLFEPAARSAFRVLGLGARAAQGEVFEAASALRLALKVGVRKRFEGDAAWLGGVRREASDVRDAVGRLSEPRQRARERLFWFHLPAQPAHGSTLAELAAAVEALLARVPVQAERLSDDETAALHDAALLALAGLVRFDPTLRETEAWARAFRLWRRLFGGEEFWSLLVAADLKGDYEQTVTFGEVAELRRSAARVVYAHAAGRGRDAVSRNELREAARALDLLRGAELPATLLREYEEETVGSAEDKLAEEVETAFCRVDTPGFDLNAVPERRNLCNDAWRRFDLVRPRLADFARLAGTGSFYARRVFEHVSSKLFKLAVSFEKTQRPQEALFVCYTAHLLAPPGSEELPAIEAKLRTLGVFEEPREMSPAEHGERVMNALTAQRVPSKLFKDDPKGGKTLDSFTRKEDRTGCLTSAGFWLALVVACFGLQRCGVINMRSTRTSINSLPTLNVRPNLNLNLNFNYNIPPPLNLPPLSAPRPPRTPRVKRRRPPRNDNAPPAPPPTSTERVPSNAGPPRE